MTEAERRKGNCYRFTIRVSGMTWRPLITGVNKEDAIQRAHALYDRGDGIKAEYLNVEFEHTHKEHSAEQARSRAAHKLHRPHAHYRELFRQDWVA